MRLLAAFSIIIMAAVFFAVLGLNISQGAALDVKPPYAFSAGDVASELLALAFVFVFSVLFFGYGAPVALGIEGAKFASLYSTGGVSELYLAFMLPEVLVAVSAVYLGQGLLKDYQGEGLWHRYAKNGLVFLILGLLVWAAVFFGRRFV
ncbi:MAG: hypothetical protein Q8P02_04300 [Candidatus Micrarchaeota archaeon]|nr:hypothetical protein [Candidatus Micrarchaeota archaeon]